MFLHITVLILNSCDYYYGEIHVPISESKATFHFSSCDEGHFHCAADHTTVIHTLRIFTITSFKNIFRERTLQINLSRASNNHSFYRCRAVATKFSNVTQVSRTYS